MAAPFYSKTDQDIYAGGDHFIPQEQYRLGPYTPPAIMGQNTNAGIVNTSAAGSYMGYPSYEAWLLAQGGGGNGGGNDPVDNINRGGINQNLGPTNITDYESEAYGVGPTWGGTWARAQDLYSKLPTPTNLLKKVFTAGTDKYNDWKTQQEEEEAERQAITRNRINQKIINTGIYKKTYKPLGADRHPDDLTGGDVDQTGGDVQAPTKTVHSGKPTGGHHQGGGGGIGSTASKQGGAPGTKDASSDWRAEGGRIGYERGRVVNPGGYQGEEENEFSIFSPSTWFEGGPESETNPTLFGTQNSLMNKAAIGQIKDAVRAYEAQLVMGELNEEQQLDYELKLKQLEDLIAGSKGQAEGGLIGYFDGGIARLL